MTGYTVHTGSTVKFSGSWDRIFSGKPTSKPSKKTVKKTVAKAKKAPAKNVGKKSRRTKHG